MSGLTSWQRWWLNAWPHRLSIRWQVPKFLRACPDPFRGQVLEIGAGNGWTSQQILETFPQVELTATDLTTPATARFRRLQNQYGQRLKVVQADALRLPFDRASFDIVVAVNVIRYVEDVPQAIRQFLRVLRPGGLIGVTSEDMSAASSSRSQLEQLLREEHCDLVVTQGDIPYILWARKTYPVMPPATVRAAL